MIEIRLTIEKNLNSYSNSNTSKIIDTKSDIIKNYIKLNPKENESIVKFKIYSKDR